MPHCTIVGAGPGIGLSVARRFAREGYSITLVSRHPQSLADAVPDDWTLQAADAGDPASLTAAFGAIHQQHETDVLVYNVARRETNARPSQLDADDLVKTLRASVVGAVVAAPVRCCSPVAACR